MPAGSETRTIQRVAAPAMPQCVVATG